MGSAASSLTTATVSNASTNHHHTNHQQRHNGTDHTNDFDAAFLDVTPCGDPAAAAASSDDYIDILSDDDNITALFLPPSIASSSSAAAAAAADRNVGDYRRSNKRIRLSLYGTIFNFINCIVGAGAIGLGGAMASSGGIISFIVIILVAILVKLSLDLIIDLSINHVSSTTTGTNAGTGTGSNGRSVSYEDLGYAAYGQSGKVFVMISKFVYAFGCVVAYTIIIHDNFGSAIRNLFRVNEKSPFFRFIENDAWCTWIVSTSVILPLCLMRDMSALASTSFISIIAMISIVGIVIYMWYIGIGHNSTFVYDFNDSTDDSISDNNTHFTEYLRTLSKFRYPGINPSVYRHWFTIRWFGLLNNMGTFVFSFVCHHTVHLTYRSLVPELQNLSTWKFVSTASLCVSCIISLSVAVFCYMTYWDRTVSDIFQIYPDTYLIDMAKLLLCITMLLTFPLPFFTCRELLILLCFHNKTNGNGQVVVTNERYTRDPRQIDGDLFRDLNEPLLDDTNEGMNQDMFDFDVYEDGNVTAAAAALVTDDIRAPQSEQLDLSTISTSAIDVWNSALLPNDDRQLKFLYHVIVTCKLWFVITVMALSAPNLGDVLDFIGCCSGTLIAFVLPGLFAIRLQGWTVIATVTLLVGGIIGIIGTICSLQKLFQDAIG